MKIDHIHIFELFGTPISEEKIKETALALSKLPAFSFKLSSILERKNVTRRAESIAGLYLLSRCGNVPANARILHTESGKPFFEGDEIFFNISHSGGFCVCATHRAPVGIDVERLRPHPSAKRFVERYFCDEEKRFFENHADQTLAFWRVWTRKEALLKYLGDGLKFDLRNINTLNCELCFRETSVKSNGGVYLITACTRDE